MSNTVILEDSYSSSSAPSDEKDEFLPPAKKKLHSSPRLKPLDQTLTSTWYREQLSIRQASTSFIATEKSLCHDVSKSFVTRFIVYRAWVVNGRKMARKIEETLFENLPPLVLYWDSKL
ncbi:unnamed protein product [Psylliodes chrysocephalus]|uniref:Uncharacterized protein n=1 Tax=Psylliodes chrysocephalus TaxID=3402493 RepID=A0A9P0CUD4_9CUCU|nr:unnamed protein product [Psylliodes chrysocephala]